MHLPPASVLIGTPMTVLGGVMVAISDFGLTIVGQAGPPVEMPHGQLTMIGLGIAVVGFATAGLPHAYNSFKLIVEDRKDRRVAERAAYEHDQRVVELANKVNRHLVKLRALEGIEQKARELQKNYEVLQALYQKEVQDDLKPAMADNKVAIAGNTKAIAELQSASNSGIFPVFPDGPAVTVIVDNTKAPDKDTATTAEDSRVMGEQKDKQEPTG